MSGHLLLGVVRIYSKQVDYFYQDCNVALVEILKAFSSVNTNINLPEGATQAPYHSITLPETLALDKIDLEDYSDLERSEDDHRGRREEITLEDQEPTGRDPHEPTRFTEDVGRGSPDLEETTVSGLKPVEEDSRPSVPEDITVVIGDPSPSNQGGLNEKPGRDSTTQELPDIEVMRDAVHDFRMEDAPVWPDQGYDVELDRVLEEQIMKLTEASSPVVEEILVSGGPTMPLPQAEEPQCVASEQAHENFNLDIPFGHASPGLAIRSTPPVEQPRAKQRKKRSRDFYDEQTVLTNKSMKKALEDSSDLLRKKRDCPSSNLDMWKSQKRLKKDRVFLEPLITGLSADLVSIYKKEVISSKPHLVGSEEPHLQPRDAQIPTPGGDKEMEIENLRNYVGPSGGNEMFNILPSPNRFISSPTMSMASPIRRGESTPATTNFGSEPDRLETTIGTDVQTTPDLAASSGPFGSDMETPATLLGGALGVENTVLSDIPEMLNSAGDLSFLEQDEKTPGGTPRTPESDHLTRKQMGTPEFDILSARTRAVAQYLRRQSSVATNSEELSGILSLNSILEGKTRKISARMFFETLVLKNYALVDVNQEEPYSDIALKVTSKLIKEKFPS
ncbi:sister chromatid cohesion 1 protein 3 isoform X2 [Coffea arabica]